MNEVAFSIFPDSYPVNGSAAKGGFSSRKKALQDVKNTLQGNHGSSLPGKLSAFTPVGAACAKSSKHQDTAPHCMKEICSFSPSFAIPIDDDHLDWDHCNCSQHEDTICSSRLFSECLLVEDVKYLRKGLWAFELSSPSHRESDIELDLGPGISCEESDWDPLKPSATFLDDGIFVAQDLHPPTYIDHEDS